MVNIVLCGGSGKRLWPLSRVQMPKQFLKLFSGKSLFQLTIERNLGLSEKRIVVSNKDHYYISLNHIEELHSSEAVLSTTTFILEPFGRNTAPAVAMACFSLSSDEVVLVTPSDHLIKREDVYRNAVRLAEEVAGDGFLVTFGTKPKYPETGYGYIEASEGSSPVRDVLKFHEKPDHATARRYLDMKNFFWNSGIFCFKAGVFLDELKSYAPEIYSASLKAYQDMEERSGAFFIHPDSMSSIPEDSIDYAVMEKSSKVKVIPVDMEWTDLGSFDSLHQELPKDDLGNSVVAKSFYGDGSHNNLIISHKSVATIGMDGLIVVDTKDALLIAKRGDGQKVKEIASSIEESEKDLVANYHTVCKPWGSYTVIDEGGGYKIKRITVKPGEALSLQKHSRRAEHWIVVKGVADVTVGTRKLVLREGDSVFIPKECLHSLSNPVDRDLEVIEVQVGDYLGEDDIVRVSDKYGRS